MNRFYATLAIGLSVFLGESACCTRSELPQNASIDENNADDMALVSIFGDRDKAALWKELGALFRKGKVRTITSSDRIKYQRTNLALIEHSNDESSEENIEAEEEEDLESMKDHVTADAEALMYYLFPRADERSVSIDEINKILNIPEERMEIVNKHWEDLLLWAEPRVRIPSIILAMPRETDLSKY